MKTAAWACASALLIASSALGKPSGVPEPRASLVSRAKVWLPSDIPSINLFTGPTGPLSFLPGATVECTYQDRKLRGKSPKFACELLGGDVLKVKYGGDNGEVFGEVVASRLL